MVQPTVITDSKETNKATAKFDKYIIIGLLIVICVIVGFLFMGRNDGSKNYTPSYEYTEDTTPVVEDYAVEDYGDVYADSVAVVDSIAAW